MTDYHALRGLLNAAKKEAKDRELWSVAAVIDELIGDVDFLQAIQDTEARTE